MCIKPGKYLKGHEYEQCAIPKIDGTFYTETEINDAFAGIYMQLLIYRWGSGGRVIIIIITADELLLFYSYSEV